MQRQSASQLNGCQGPENVAKAKSPEYLDIAMSEGWLGLLPVKQPIECFLPIKTPISQKTWLNITCQKTRNAPENMFRLQEFLALVDTHRIGLVIDLSASRLPCYSVRELETRGLKHKKLNGTDRSTSVTQISLDDIYNGVLDNFVDRFIDTVDWFHRCRPRERIAVQGVSKWGDRFIGHFC